MLQSVLTVLGTHGIFPDRLHDRSGRLEEKEKVSGFGEKFAEVPGEREQNENTGNYYENFGEGGVDDVTWNDLSMDTVFGRLNQCDSSAGEEMLYGMGFLGEMPCPKKNGSFLKSAWNSLRRTRRSALLRRNSLPMWENVRLSDLIPSYIDGIEEYQMSHMWAFRILQAALVAAAVVLLVFRTDEAAFPLLAVCAACPLCGG